MSQTKYLFGLFQAPNMSKHISRNRGAQKTAYDKVFFVFFGTKRPFSPSKKGYNPKSVHVYWY